MESHWLYVPKERAGDILSRAFSGQLTVTANGMTASCAPVPDRSDVVGLEEPVRTRFVRLLNQTRPGEIFAEDR